ncbi:hypothetical protein [Geopseudomonas aromaticivorans]
MDKDQMRILARNPAAMARFQATGKLPQLATPTGPLIDLLKAIPPMYRSRITGLTVGPALGYGGRRQFHTAEQALNWCNPTPRSQHPPAESWRDKRFSRPLYLDDLLAHASSYPEQIRNHCSGLLSPQALKQLRQERAQQKAATAEQVAPEPFDSGPAM